MTDHFTLAELTASEYALRHGINNMPTDATTLTNLAVLANGLERIRSIIGQPIHISSGYRNALVNKAIGGTEHSAHQRGLAADIVVPGVTAQQLAHMIKMNRRDVAYDQLIYEGTWVHVAFIAPGAVPRGSELTAHFPGPTYTEGIA